MTAGDAPAFQARDRLDGDDLRAMFSGAAELLERNVEAINALNVFPVPDGDTGINMYLTMRDVMEEAGRLEGAAAADVASAMARAALMGARGNSGVILSQFFKGIEVALQDRIDFGADEMARAYREATQHAYTAVANPVEGTMLTVMRSTADAAEEALAGQGNLQDVSEAASAAAKESVARTPTMLAVLREAGVVDAGGHGFAIILEAVRRYVRGEQIGELEIAVPEPVGIQAGAGAVSADFLDATEEERYGYCTQFLVEGEGLDVQAIRDRMSALAGSAVVVGDETAVKVHVHTDDPGPAISVAVSLGTLGQVNIQNMDEQHSEFSADRRREGSTVSVAVLPVASGKGLEELFMSLGASAIITGGDTMNPSVRDIVEAVEAAPSEQVVVLPNNKNIAPAAVQAAELSSKRVEVVATTSIPQGVAASLAFDAEADLEANVGEMREAASATRTGEVTEAVRAVSLNGVSVRPGQLIGLLERELVAAGDDLVEVVLSLVRSAGLSEGELVTLYWGEYLDENMASEVAERIADAMAGAEVEVVYGGQPHYHFYVSIE